jgi:pyruvate dehydrogenase E2 component (dihydrolipoamide acetyltransferase)
MPATVIMPALELAQETGKVLRWLKSPGDAVVKGEPIVEIETDKVTVEVEAPASGVLREVSAHEGDVVAVGKTIALIFAAGEAPAEATVKASPLARKLAEAHGVDLSRVRTTSGRIEKADVLAHVDRHQAAGDGVAARLVAASPKPSAASISRP